MEHLVGRSSPVTINMAETTNSEYRSVSLSAPDTVFKWENIDTDIGDASNSLSDSPTEIIDLKVDDEQRLETANPFTPEEQARIRYETQRERFHEAIEEHRREQARTNLRRFEKDPIWAEIRPYTTELMVLEYLQSGFLSALGNSAHAPTHRASGNRPTEGRCAKLLESKVDIKVAPNLADSSTRVTKRITKATSVGQKWRPNTRSVACQTTSLGVHQYVQTEPADLEDTAATVVSGGSQTPTHSSRSTSIHKDRRRRRKSQKLTRDRDASHGQQRRCFNCGVLGHHRTECSAPARRLCFRCGKSGVTIRECPKCQEGWRAEGPYVARLGRNVPRRKRLPESAQRAGGSNSRPRE